VDDVRGGLDDRARDPLASPRSWWRRPFERSGRDVRLACARFAVRPDSPRW
jgi:hypothetical protein